MIDILTCTYITDVIEILQGPVMNCARLAEKAVALVCCEKLHKIGKTTITILQTNLVFLSLLLHLLPLPSKVNWMIT